MDLHVRDFEERDRPPLRDLYLLARQAAYPWAKSEILKSEDFDRDTEGECIFVAESGEQVVGFASLWKEDNFLHNLFVDPQTWRRGVGTSLLRHCATVSNAPLTLKCLKANTGALQFYARMGWRIVGEGAAPDGLYFLMKSGNGGGDGRDGPSALVASTVGVSERS